MGFFSKFKEKKGEQLLALFMPLEGNVVIQEDINDQMFSSGVMGQCVGVKSVKEIDTVLSPISGEVTMIFPTKHAVALKSQLGIELLIHIGIDTVELNGEGFYSHVKLGDKVKRGDKLITVDFKKISELDYDTTTIIVVTNSSKFKSVNINKDSKNWKILL